MKLCLSVLATALLPFANGDDHPRKTETITTNLRGGNVVRKRISYPDKTDEGMKPENLEKVNLLIDQKLHHHAHGHLHLRQMSEDGKVKDMDVDMDNLDENDIPPEVLHNIEDFMFSYSEAPHDHQSHESPAHQSMHHGHPHREDLHAHQADPQHFDKHHAVKDHHHHKRTTHDDKASRKVILPTGFDSHYNRTLYHRLLVAPFEIYADIFDHHFWGETSFPVFAVPDWQNRTGIFSGFGKSGDSLIFENMQFLLHWHDIIGASDGVSQELYEYMSDHDFHASLIIGKAHQELAETAHLALVVSYYQFGSKKNVLIPFARIEDFFDDTSEQHLKNSDTKDLEMSALHEMIRAKRSNSTSFNNPAMNNSDERIEAFGVIEAFHFQKLFQLLIRRTFLFSFGYADCLMQEPDYLRQCLDDTYSSVVKMETNVRGALDDQIVEQLAVVNDRLHTKVAEACVSFQNMGASLYGSRSCDDTLDLGTLITTPFKGKLQ
jgi:hypothetical protein